MRISIDVTHKKNAEHGIVLTPGRDLAMSFGIGFGNSGPRLAHRWRVMVVQTRTTKTTPPIGAGSKRDDFMQLSAESRGRGDCRLWVRESVC